MAREIALGVDGHSKAESLLRQLPDISANCEQTQQKVPDKGAPYATSDDLQDCAGLILGSPGYFGNMAAAVKYFLDQTTPLWLSGALVGKPAGVFTSTSSQHGGQESVLLSMMNPLLHHGMLISGIPYSVPALHRTSTGATPYGPSHVAGSDGASLSDDETAACRAFGLRIADLADKLSD